MKIKKFYDNIYLYLSIGIVIVFWGFSESYFTKLGQTTLAYHFHGISATLWMILLIIQPFLYKKGYMKIHRYIGWSSLILVPILVLSGFQMMRLMIQNQANYPPDIVYSFAFIDAITLFGFTILYSLAIFYRKNLKLHARFMVCTLFGPLIPAITRVFFSIGLAHNFNECLTFSYFL